MPMSPVEMAMFNPSTLPRKWVRSRSGIASKCVTLYNDWTGAEINVSVEPQMGGGDTPDPVERENNIILREIKKGFLPYPPANPKMPTSTISKDQLKTQQEREEFEEIMQAVTNIRAKRARNDEAIRGLDKPVKGGGANAK